MTNFVGDTGDNQTILIAFVRDDSPDDDLVFVLCWPVAASVPQDSNPTTNTNTAIFVTS